MSADHDIFVFGSNLAGRHGAGSAREALLRHGAKRGIGVGPTGKAFAIPTKDYHLQTLPLTDIAAYVRLFVQYAKSHPHLIFNVVKIGCGLAGYTENEIAPLFAGAPPNVRLPDGWRAYELHPTPVHIDRIASDIRNAVEKCLSQLDAKPAYGFCPHCGAPGTIRELRPNGNDCCKNGHCYPSAAALNEPRTSERPS